MSFCSTARGREYTDLARLLYLDDFQINSVFFDDIQYHFTLALLTIVLGTSILLSGSKWLPKERPSKRAS
jgi:hypothetical protein